jgi:DMSO/TMAO reductase YedYZ heme-binding membrane subunit/uncharacterized protein with FMN-binding domain
MLFAISLLFAGAFSVLCGKALRKHPTLFYTAAAVLSIGTVIFANTRISIPAFVQQNIISLFTKGILAAAFWAVVMWTGALPNQSELRKKLLPQRGQLSIFAAILTLGHAVGFIISIFPRWIQKADVLNLTVCIGLLLIMLPLTVISVQKIRRKMKAKTWKSVQRWAYLFYALIPVHVIVLNLAKAQRGNTEVRVNLLLYLAVFLGYAVCRVHKWYLVKRDPSRQIGAKLVSWCAFLTGIALFAAAVFPQKQAETTQTKNAEIHEETAQTDTTTAVTTKITSQTSATVTTTDTDSTETTETSETTSIDITETTTTADDSEDISETPEQNEPADNPETVPAETEPPAPVRIYQDGIFTATAYGYDGDITVHVTIQNDTITDITAETEESDDSYFFDAKSAVIPAIICSQAADVDACSGATYSSNGIMAAVRAALEQARI